MRPRLHANNADKQRAYRERRRSEAQPVPEGRGLPVKQPRRPARPARIAALLAAVEALADEYRAWHESIPDNLASASLAEQLEDTITRLEGAAELLAEIEPPRIGR